MPSKRRKGKQGGSASGRNTPASEASVQTTTEEDQQQKQQAKPSQEEIATTDTEMKDSAKNNGDGATEDNNSSLKNPDPKTKTTAAAAEEDMSLVLTSSAKRGVYECDYCHSDISQLPRIRCAVCSDFDLCLDCFATTDHTAAMARIKAAATAQQELSKDGIATSASFVPALTSTDHDGTHGYRVCDSTRFPIFASTRMMEAAAQKDVGNNTKDTATADDKMDVDTADTESKKSYTPSEGGDNDAASTATTVVLTDDPKASWTAEEDLRLLDGILTHGLGNWTEISEAVGGLGSTGKTPKRCMERYFDDFLGRYGHILPPYIIVDDDDDDIAGSGSNNVEASTDGDKSTSNNEDDETEAVRASKRRSSMLMRSPSGLSSVSRGGARKKVKVVSTDSIPGYENVWPEQYLPTTDVQVGQSVAREQSYKAELAFVKQTAGAASKEEAEKIREEWMKTRMGKIGSPTVLPPRPEDTTHLPGAELAGFMPRRGDLDIEWDNDAEAAIGDMEFSVGDLPQDKQLKIQVLQIYHRKQEEREKRKNFILRRELFDYRKMLKEEQTLPADERDLVRRMRLFERLHTPEEHKTFLADILKAKRLRKEIAKLQMYRRIGIKSLAEAEKFELDKSRRQFHKMAKLQKDAEAKARAQAAPGTTAPVDNITAVAVQTPNDVNDSLWKQYRTSDRKGRRSASRLDSGMASGENEHVKLMNSSSKEPSDKNEGGTNSPEETAGKTENNSMDVDQTGEDESTIRNLKGYGLLNKKEIQLCLNLKLTPSQYLEIKGALIRAALSKGLLDDEGPGSTKRAIVKIDIEKRGEVIDFIVRSGWISSKLGDAAIKATSS